MAYDQIAADALTDLDRLRKAIVTALDIEWGTGGHGAPVPTDDEIVRWVREDHRKMLNLFDTHHKDADPGFCPHVRHVRARVASTK